MSPADEVEIFLFEEEADAERHVRVFHLDQGTAVGHSIPEGTPFEE